MKWWQTITELFTGQYLRLWWVLVVLYLPLYGMARGWVGTARSRTTVVFRCRQALGFMFLFHLLATAGVMVYWWNSYSGSKSAGLYLMLYGALALVDLFGMVAQFVGASRFRTYAS
jgi:hypothetical protein